MYVMNNKMYVTDNKMENKDSKMEDRDNKMDKPPTLHELIKALGDRTNVVGDALRRLIEQGHTYTRSAIYTTIQRDGRNNPIIATAVLDAIEAEKQARAAFDARRQALAA
ncbi:hypothetical protein GCM10022409_46720 [Hymenobacter glaciei]|uniref:KfrA N-terminal DNA-binding domain-containing protein n=2 Tax=Hymenobacter glaciei TaxID=877209 RepID=A0ABP7UWM2_9BACT